MTDSSQMYQFLCIRTTHVEDCSVPILPMQNTDVSVELTCSAYFNNKRNLIIIFASSQLAPMLRRFLIHLTRVTLVLPPKRVMTFRDMTSQTETETNQRDPRIFVASGLRYPLLLIFIPYRNLSLPFPSTVGDLGLVLGLQCFQYHLSRTVRS